MNLSEVGMDNFCTFHQQPHSKKNFPQWINYMTLVMNQLLDSKLTEPMDEEEKLHEPKEVSEETTMVLQDCAPMLGLEEEEPNEEMHLSYVNVTTRRKGPIIEDNTLLPKIKRIQENMKKVRNNTQSQLIPGLVITSQNTPTVSKPIKDTERKVEGIKKNSIDYEMGYDIIEDIKKTKDNISLFKICSLPQQKKKLL